MQNKSIGNDLFPERMGNIYERVQGESLLDWVFKTGNLQGCAEHMARLRKNDGDSLCHGDFHPGNILLSNGHTMVIDFMNVYHGDFLYDVARTVFF